MREKKHRTLSVPEMISIIFLAYPVGLLVGLFFMIGRFLGRVQIINEERFPKSANLKNTILVSNHPSVIDPFLVAYLLSRYYVFHPIRHAPLIVADRIKFYDSWWFFPLRPVMIPVDRGNNGAEATALIKIKSAIEGGRTVILFPEGGRTFKGDGGTWQYSQKGNKTNRGRIRTLKGGVGLLVRRAEATILPIGILGSDEVVPNSQRRLWTRFIFRASVTINIGNPMKFEPRTAREEITQRISSELLQLIDEMI